MFVHDSENLNNNKIEIDLTFDIDFEKTREIFIE